MEEAEEGVGTYGANESAFSVIVLLRRLLHH
jgi:hypothetical protein